MAQIDTSFIKKWSRVLKLSRKPKRNEFTTIAKITGLGIILLGFMGFIIRLITYVSGNL